MAKIRLPLPPHMAALPNGSRTAYRGQWATKVEDHIEAEIPISLFEMWKTRFHAELVEDVQPEPEPEQVSIEADNIPDVETPPDVVDPQAPVSPPRKKKGDPK